MDDDWDLEVANGPPKAPARGGGWQTEGGGQGWVGRGRGQQPWTAQNGDPGRAALNADRGQAWGSQSSGQAWGSQSSGQAWGAQNGDRGQAWGQGGGQSWGSGGQGDSQGWGSGSQGDSQGWGSGQGGGRSDGRGWRSRGGGGGGRSDARDWRGRSGGGDQGRPPPPPPDGLTMTINSSDVSKIIGRAGSNIRELEQNSGAKIRIDRGDGGPEARVIFVGEPDVQERAKLIVEQFLLDLDSRPRRGGRSPSPVPRKPASYQPPSGERPEFNLALAIQMQAEGDKERWSKVPPMKKEFYHEDPEVANMPQDEVAEIRKSMNDVHVSCDKRETAIPNPVTRFDQAFSAYPEILDEIKKVGFETPTPIQAQGWPVLLSGHDMIGIAQTGSGKTLAFLLPALIHTDLQPVPREDRGGPNVLVLSPTRELALQTEKEVARFNYKGIRSVCVYGGGDRRAQVKACCSGVEIIIATPGRLNDLIMAGYIDVSSITYLVLDEADRMLDMGFEPDIRKVLLDIRPDRQTVMTSATWPIDVRRIADKYMHDPVHVVVGSLDLKACRTVEQIVVFCKDEEEKTEKLGEYLHNMSPEEKIIVFFGRKAKASQLSIDFGVAGVDLQSIHGDRPQEEREIAIDDLISGDCRVLFATDVASRGIDIPDVTLIINFDFPRHIEDYVHRVGRTGRAGKSGRAVTFLTREDWRHASELIEILAKNEAEVPEWLQGMADRFSSMRERREAEGGGRRGGGGGGGGRGFGGRGRSGGRGGGRRDFF